MNQYVEKSAFQSRLEKVMWFVLCELILRDWVFSDRLEILSRENELCGFVLLALRCDEDRKRTFCSATKCAGPRRGILARRAVSGNANLTTKIDNFRD
jgi:hypothetical protein